MKRIDHKILMNNERVHHITIHYFIEICEEGVPSHTQKDFI